MLSFKFRFLLLLNFSDLILLPSYFNLTKSLALSKRLKLGQKPLKLNNGLRSCFSLAKDYKLGMKLLFIKVFSSCDSFFWFLLRSRLERRFSSWIFSFCSSSCFCSSSYWSAPPYKLIFLCVRQVFFSDTPAKLARFWLRKLVKSASRKVLLT